LTQNGPTKVSIEALPEEVRKLARQKTPMTFLGSMLTTQGTLALFFSHRYNEEYSFLIPGTDRPKILSIIYDALDSDDPQMEPQP